MKFFALLSYTAGFGMTSIVGSNVQKVTACKAPSLEAANAYFKGYAKERGIDLVENAWDVPCATQTEHGLRYTSIEVEPD